MRQLWRIGERVPQYITLDYIHWETNRENYYSVMYMLYTMVYT